MPRRTILWLFASLLFVHHHVLADGMALKGLDRSLLLPAEEKEQRAIIQFENYRQTMLLAVNLDMEREEHGLWIVPIPGAASEIQIDLDADFPSFVGQDPRKESAQSLKAISAFIRAW